LPLCRAPSLDGEVSLGFLEGCDNLGTPVRKSLDRAGRDAQQESEKVWKVAYGESVSAYPSSDREHAVEEKEIAAGE
jgi:hypothetical protein